eukprot:scaffold320249_cov38-Prasinocladus_malaysianus.AAC.1
MLRLEGPLQDAVKAATRALSSGASTSQAHGAPAVLVLSASAVMANNLVKKLRDPSFGKVAKLFAKHIKVRRLHATVRRMLECVDLVSRAVSFVVKHLSPVANQHIASSSQHKHRIEQLDDGNALELLRWHH